MSNSVFQFPYSWKRIYGITGNLKQIPHMLKWAYQRVMRGYADCDVWSFDCFLAKIIPAGLRQLAEGQSYPHEFGTREEWSKWLIETAELFEKGYDDGVFVLVGEEIEEHERIIKTALERFKEQFCNLWD